MTPKEILMKKDKQIANLQRMIKLQKHEELEFLYSLFPVIGSIVDDVIERSDCYEYLKKKIQQLTEDSGDNMINGVLHDYRQA